MIEYCFEVGQTWARRDGNEVQIISVTDTRFTRYPIRGDDELCRDVHGRVYRPDMEDPLDLVHRVLKPVSETDVREQQELRVFEKLAKDNPVPVDKNKALKFDSGKPPMSLIPQAALQEVAKVMGFGAQKYAPHNWRNGFKWSRLADASLRHITSYCDGYRQDPETGLSHMAHAACMVLMLIQHEVEGLGEDDMYVKDEGLREGNNE